MGVTFKRIGGQPSCPRVSCGAKKQRNINQRRKPSNSGGFHSKDSIDEASTLEPVGEVVEAHTTVGTSTSPISQEREATINDGLPSVGRGDIMRACIQTSGLIAVAGVVLHFVCPLFAPAVTDGQVETFLYYHKGLNVDPSTIPNHIALSTAVAMVVTSGRKILASMSSGFREATDRSNAQVLSPLGPADVIVVSAVPAVSEELLFRWALIPSVYPDWRGVIIAGFVFGVLHINGGRNAAFAIWATAVGCLYGELYLLTGDIVFGPILAHTMGNIASAALWLRSNKHSC